MDDENHVYGEAAADSASVATIEMRMASDNAMWNPEKGIGFISARSTRVWWPRTASDHRDFAARLAAGLEKLDRAIGRRPY